MVFAMFMNSYQVLSLHKSRSSAGIEMNTRLQTQQRSIPRGAETKVAKEGWVVRFCLLLLLIGTCHGC